MATNKQAIIRYRVIDRCLRNIDGRWNWQTLAEECSNEIAKVLGQEYKTISERTIKGDISAMRNDTRLAYYAPIEYDRKEKSYYYTNQNYSITESPISKDEAKELQNMINLMRQFTGFKYMSGIENILNKLELIVHESTRSNHPIVLMEQPVVITGEHWLDTCYKAIKDKKAINISYQSFEGVPSSTIISPYLLKEYKNRWFLIACKNENEQIRTYGLERIVDIGESLSPFKEIGFDFQEYFKDVIGISMDPTVQKEKISFKVTGSDRHYILTNPFHHSQKVLQMEDDKITFQIEVRPNHELKKIFLSYGDALEIL